MRIDVMTLFPQICKSFTAFSIVKRAIDKNILKIKFHQIRNFAKDKHKRVDDTTYGPGKGMLLKAEPISLCFENICKNLSLRPTLIYMTPTGSLLNQQKIIKLSKYKNLAILCGHYEGIDERIVNKIVDEEISIGDYVLTGGELPAMVLVDAICRLLPGVLSSSECFTKESHFSGLLEYPQYTKPDIWKKMKVPDILLSGNHKEIEKWQYKKSVLKTFDSRPDMLKKYLNKLNKVDTKSKRRTNTKDQDDIKKL